MAILVALLVVVGAGVCALRKWFDGMTDTRPHGTDEQEMRHSEEITGAVIQSGSGGFNGR